MTTKIGLRDMLGNELCIGDIVTFTKSYDRNGEMDYGEILSYRDGPKRKTVTVVSEFCNQLYMPKNEPYTRDFHIPIDEDETSKMILYRK